MATKLNRSLLTKTHRQILDRNNGNPPGWMINMIREKTQELKRLTEPGANFLVGQKKVYLPDFTVTLLRTPHLLPTQAQFRVPLNFTKLDLRDYLFHAYSVRVHSVHSLIIGPKVSPREKNPDPAALIPKIRERGERGLSKRLIKEVKAHKAEADEKWEEQEVQKMMIVDLEKPFIWPPMPTDEDDNAEGVDAMTRRSLTDMHRKNKALEANEGVDREGNAHREDLIAKQAAALREGRLTWRSEGTVQDVQGQKPTVSRRRRRRSPG